MGLLDNLATKAMQYFLNKIVEECIQLFGDAMVKIMGSATDFLSLAAVHNAILYAQGLALVILTAKVANEALQTWILYTHGDPNSSPGGLLIRTVKAVFIICSVPWIVSYLYRFGSLVAKDVVNLKGVDDVTDVSLSHLGDYVGNSMMIGSIMIIIGNVMLLFIYLQTFVRAAELACLAVVGPLVALNITSTDNSMYTAWIREIIIISISQALQIFMVKTSFYVLSGGMGQVSSAYSLLIFLAFLWVTIKSPKFLKQFAYASGLGGVAGGAVQQVGNAMLMRKVLTKGAA